MHIVGSPECPFRLDGKNLGEYRRARLRILAKRLDISADGTKVELLQRLIARLHQLQSPPEIGELRDVAARKRA